MRIANVDGRAAIVIDEKTVDLETASGGRFAADPSEIFVRWSELLAWYAQYRWSLRDGRPLDSRTLGAPSPRPRQVFAVANNFHNKSSPVAADPELPVVFTKFPSCITGPVNILPLPTETVDWEVELVAVVGSGGHRIRPDEAWDALAGVTLGQDFSERTVQLAGVTRQFALGKSFPGFGPTGPVLVSADELPDRNDLVLRCTVNSEVVQNATTAEMIFSVAELVSRLSEVCELLPGDLIFTGTPGGLGMSMDPPRYLRPDDVVESYGEGIGVLRTVCASG